MYFVRDDENIMRGADIDQLRKFIYGPYSAYGVVWTA